MKKNTASILLILYATACASFPKNKPIEIDWTDSCQEPWGPSHLCSIQLNRGALPTDYFGIKQDQDFDTLVAFIQDHKEKIFQITIIGHVQSIGNIKNELALGDEIASPAKNLLISKGVEPKTIVSATSYGAELPASVKRDDPANFRIEVKVEKMNRCPQGPDVLPE